MRADDDLTYQEYKDSVESNMSLNKTFWMDTEAGY